LTKNGSIKKPLDFSRGFPCRHSGEKVEAKWNG